MIKTSNLSASDIARVLRIDFSASEMAILNKRKLDDLCKLIAGNPHFRQFRRETWSDPLYWNADDSRENRSQYFAIGNAINFRYWNKIDGVVKPIKGIKRGIECQGALYMWRCLRICLEEHSRPLLSASFLTNITESQFNDIFSPDQGENPLNNCKKLRIANLQDLGDKLLSSYD